MTIYILSFFLASFMDLFVDNQTFNVRFVFNRLPTRLQHRACQLADELSLEPILFPKEDALEQNTAPVTGLK